jgi:hypothetical protein
LGKGSGYEFADLLVDGLTRTRISRILTEEEKKKSVFFFFVCVIRVRKILITMILAES